MKNKKVRSTVIFAVVCVVVILAVLIIGYQKKNTGSTPYKDPGATGSFDTLDEAVEWAGFKLKCSDRLNGLLATDYSANKTAITVTFGEAGYIRKALIPEDVEDGENAQSTEESRTTYEINGLTVWFRGEENAVYEAEWIDNGFDYVISLNQKSVSADVMTDYILATM